jgi:hypothetical protein
MCSQVAPGGDQLVSFVRTPDRVVSLDEILPGELGVPRLGDGGGQVEAQWVGVVLAQEVGHIHERAAALA